MRNGKPIEYYESYCGGNGEKPVYLLDDDDTYSTVYKGNYGINDWMKFNVSSCISTEHLQGLYFSIYLTMIDLTVYMVVWKYFLYRALQCSLHMNPF